MYRKKGKKLGSYIGGILGRGTYRGYWEYSGDLVTLCTICRAHTQVVLLWGGGGVVT